MADALDPDGWHDDVRTAAEALTDTTAPDVEVLAAVHDGLRLVPAAAPGSWFGIPSQRYSRDDNQLGWRRGT